MLTQYPTARSVTNSPVVFINRSIIPCVKLPNWWSPILNSTHFEFYPFWILPILNFIYKWYSSSWSPPSEVLPPLGGLHNWVWIPIAGWTSFGIDFILVRMKRWEFFPVGQFQFGKISKWMDLNLVGNQFGSFTMGVNLKKVNINLEFVSERPISPYWHPLGGANKAFLIFGQISYFE